MCASPDESLGWETRVELERELAFQQPSRFKQQAEDAESRWVFQPE